MFSFMDDEPLNFMSECSTVIPGQLYLSGFIPANDKALLDNLAIKHVVRLGDDYDLLLYETHEGIEYHTINITDSFDSRLSQELLDGAVAFIQSATTPVLVHCRAGVSRSASIVVAFLMKVHKKSCKDALIFVKDKRRCARPNSTFLKDLQAYITDSTPNQ